MNNDPTGRAITTSCLVNNYDYGHFVRDAIESALQQSVPFDEIIVVDDGSTDGSAKLLTNAYAGHDRIRVLTKHNEGQLSCFNEGFARAQGQIIFFLDADDILEPNYVAKALDVYRSQAEVDFVFCGLRLFGDIDRVDLQYEQNCDLGYSAAITALKQHWIGAPTSCLSMRRWLLNEILPLPFVDSWRIRADDCLVFGASLAGARKYYIAEPLVRYRVHSQNRFFGVEQDKFTSYRRQLAINTLMEHYRRKLCYDPSRFGDFLHHEFSTIGQPSYRYLKGYSKLVMNSKASLTRRLSRIATMTRHYLGTRVKPAAPRKMPAVLTQATTAPAALSEAQPSSRDLLSTGQHQHPRKAA